MGQDYHPTGTRYVYYVQPILRRTGCLGATKGCLTTGPTMGNNPVKAVGEGFDVFVDYTNARCRFQQSSVTYYDRIATRADGDFLGTGLLNGSITTDGTELYCITPKSDVADKIVTEVAVALNGEDFVQSLTASTSQYSYYPQTVYSIEPAGGSFFESTLVTVTGEFFPGFDGLRGSARCKFGDELSTPTVLEAKNGIIVCSSPPRALSKWPCHHPIFFRRQTIQTRRRAHIDRTCRPQPNLGGT